MAAAKPITALPNVAPDIQGAIMKALREMAPILKSSAIGNLDRALRRRSGKLASSIYSRARKIKGGGKLTTGTPVIYGRFWEYGFFRGKKSVFGLHRGAARAHRRRFGFERARLIKGGAKFYQAQWLRPAVEAAMPEVTRRVEMHVNNALKGYSGSTTTIDIKFG